MKKVAIAALITVTALASVHANANDGRRLTAGLIGGTAGAIIGRDVGGRNGAVAGAIIGVAIGTSIAHNDHYYGSYARYESAPVYYAPYYDAPSYNDTPYYPSYASYDPYYPSYDSYDPYYTPRPSYYAAPPAYRSRYRTRTHVVRHVHVPPRHVHYVTGDGHRNHQGY